VREQMAELDAVLRALRASNETSFAMTVRGTTYRERAEAAPVLLDSLPQAYVEGNRYGNTKEFPIATLRGVEVSASPLRIPRETPPPSVHRPVSQDLPDLVDTFRRRSGGPQTAVPSVYPRSPRRPLHGNEAPACSIMHRLQ